MRTDSAKVLLISSIVAAVLALTAAVIRYTKSGSVPWSLVAAAVVVLMFGLASRNKAAGK